MSDKSGSGERGGAEGGLVRGENDGQQRPFIDDVFAVLADWRRREICQFFIETETDTATVDDLALLVAGCQPETLDESPSSSHEELVTELEETHLPQLAAAAIVDYDSRSGTVKYWGQPTVEKWLEHVIAVNRRK